MRRWTPPSKSRKGPRLDRANGQGRRQNDPSARPEWPAHAPIQACIGGSRRGRHRCLTGWPGTFGDGPAVGWSGMPARGLGFRPVRGTGRPGDTGQVGPYRDQVVPRVTEVVMNRADLRRIRDRVAAGLAGEVLEVGFGSGLNVPHYPSAVTRVLAVDPARAGRKLAARRIAASPVLVEFAGLDGEQLPVADAEAACSSPDWTPTTCKVRNRSATRLRAAQPNQAPRPHNDLSVRLHRPVRRSVSACITADLGASTGGRWEVDNRSERLILLGRGRLQP
jgi:hypothetical protein